MVAGVTQRSRSAGQRSRSAGIHTGSKNAALNLPDRPRHLSPSNCCHYCDRYEGEMTQNRHQDIDAWRMDVNRNMEVDKKPSFRQQKKEDSKKKYKLIYLKHTPPGSPDIDDGFRRIPVQNETQQWARKHAHWQTDFDMDNLSTDLGSISLNVADRSDFANDFTSTLGSTANRSTKTAKTTASAKSDVTCLSQGTDFSRSNSNRLLNVLTIDDYKYRYGSTYSKVTNDLGNKSAANEAPQLKRTDSACSRSKSQRAGSAGPSGYNLTSDVTFDLHSDLGSQAEYHNETIERAFETMMGVKKPINNDAHRHLYPQPKVAPPHTTKQSKRFKRLHKALHKWMEDEILRPHSMRMTTATSPQPLSTYSNMLDSPTWMNGAPDPGYSSARRSSRKSRRSNLSSNDSGVINEDEEIPSYKKDNNGFLEMLMEMEDSNTNPNSTLGTVNSYGKTMKDQGV